MKKAVLTAVILMMVTAVFCGCTTQGAAKYNQNVLAGGADAAFDFESLTDLQKVWDLTSGGSDSDVFSMVSNRNEASYLKINTANAGYATVSQKLILKSFSYYKVTYRYTTTGMSGRSEDKGYVGLYVGFKENPDFNLRSDKPTEERRANSNGTASFYFKTNADREVNLAINVGTEEYPVSVSSVVIKDITLERVYKDTVTGDGVLPCYQLQSTVYGAPSIMNIVFVVLGAVGTIVIGYAVYMALARVNGWDELGKTPKFVAALKESNWKVPLIVAGATLLVRLLITLIESGLAGASDIKTVFFGFDLEQLAKQGVWLSNYGTPYFFKYFENAPIFPVPLYLSMFAGLIGKGIGLIPGATEATITLTAVCVLKLFTVFADVGTVLIIYNVVSKKWNRVAAGIIGLAYSVMPVVFSVSAGWGVMESIAVFFVVLSFARLLRSDYIGASVAYFAAAMVSPFALYLCPFLLMYAGYEVFLGIRDREHKRWISVLGCMVGGLVLFYLLALPFTVLEVGKGDAMFAFKKFISSVQASQIYTENAFNFQALLGNNFKEITTEFTLVAVLFGLFILGVFAAVYYRNRSKFDLLTLAAGFVVLYFSLICVNANQVAMMSALPLILMAAALSKDKRLYGTFVAFASLIFVNASYVYTVAGYTDTGITQIGYETSLMYIMGAFQLVAVVYAVYVMYDVVVNRKGKEILSLRVPYGVYVKSVATNAGIVMQNGWAKTKVFFQALGEAMKKDKSGGQSDSRNDKENK